MKISKELQLELLPAGTVDGVVDGILDLATIAGDDVQFRFNYPSMAIGDDVGFFLMPFTSSGAGIGTFFGSGIVKVVEESVKNWRKSYLSGRDSAVLYYTVQHSGSLEQSQSAALLINLKN